MWYNLDNIREHLDDIYIIKLIERRNGTMETKKQYIKRNCFATIEIRGYDKPYQALLELEHNKLHVIDYVEPVQGLAYAVVRAGRYTDLPDNIRFTDQFIVSDETHEIIKDMIDESVKDMIKHLGGE